MVTSKNSAWYSVLFLSLLSAVLLASAGQQNQCASSDKAKSKCCQVINLDHKLREVHINDTVCVKLRGLKARKGFRFTVFWNKRSLISHKLTTDTVPPFCFATPYIHYVDVCLKFKRLRIQRTQIRGCLQFEIDSVSSSKVHVFPGGCFLIKRKFVPSIQNDGNFFKLLKSTKMKQISLEENSLPLKSFIVKNAINQTSLAIWLKIAKNKNTTALNKLLGGKLLSGRNTQASHRRRPTLSSSDCWCRDQLFVTCECCVPINDQNNIHRGCVKLIHIPYGKDISLSFALDGEVKIKEKIPSVITRRLCAHHKISSNLKVGACIKPLPHQRRQNRNGLCIDIDVRKPHFRFKHRVGCVSLVVAWGG